MQKNKPTDYILQQCISVINSLDFAQDHTVNATLNFIQPVWLHNATNITLSEYYCGCCEVSSKVTIFWSAWSI